MIEVGFGRANEVGFGKGTRFHTNMALLRVLKAGFGIAVEVKFDCANLALATEEIFYSAQTAISI